MGSPSTDQLAKRIVERLSPLHPKLVLLFGSRATGREAPESDCDLLVVADLPGNRAERHVRVRQALGDLGVPVDLLVYQPEQWTEWKDVELSFEHEIASTGRVLYVH